MLDTDRHFAPHFRTLTKMTEVDLMPLPFDEPMRKHQSGEIQLIMGPMFSGKTTGYCVCFDVITSVSRRVDSPNSSDENPISALFGYCLDFKGVDLFW